MKTDQELNRIKKRFIKKYMVSGSGISGVGIGKNAVGDPCLIVYLEYPSAKDNLPDVFESVEVCFEDTGSIEAS